MRDALRAAGFVVLAIAVGAAIFDAGSPAEAAPGNARASAPTRLVAQYIVRVQVHEQGSWDMRTQEACSDRTESGTQVLDSDSAKTGNGLKPYAWLFVKQPGQLAVYGYTEGGSGLKMKQQATVTVEADQQTVDKACDEPVNTCEGCEASEPPTVRCGTRTGTLSFPAPYAVNAGADVRAFSAPIGYQLDPPYPYDDESGRTFCPNNALSQWQSILAYENRYEVVVPARKPLRYFSLSAKDQAACQRWAKFEADPCKANFTVKFKELKTVNTPLPQYNVSRYESVVTYSFWFSGVCSTTNGRQTCFDRLPNRWKRVASLPGDPGS